MRCPWESLGLHAYPETLLGSRGKVALEPVLVVAALEALAVATVAEEVKPGLLD